jgi:hypothetical protein
MAANFLHPSLASPGSSAGPQAAAERVPTPAGFGIDWHAVRLARRSCCCPARPVAIAVLAPTPDRPRQAELLFCGHHYRAAADALAAAGATVLDTRGYPVKARPAGTGDLRP